MAGRAEGKTNNISAEAAQDKTLFLVHTNDTHSCVEPLSPDMSDTANADKGGFVRRAVLVERLRHEHPGDMLLLDCGDFSQGSVYYTLFRGEVEVKLMNHMGYDAAVLGNHEFDSGLENLARLARMAKFPFVCTNYDFSGTPCEGLVKPYVIVQRGGLRVGVVGVSHELRDMVPEQNYGKVRLLPTSAALQQVVDRLREREKCDFIVCLSHLGWYDGEFSDAALIRATEGIDVVLGGHTHLFFEQPRYVQNRLGQPVPCNQMGKHGRYVGTMEFLLEPYSK